MLVGGLDVRGIVAHGEEAGVELRVERLDPAVHNLREAGEVRHRPQRHTALGERTRGATSRDDLDPQLAQPAGKLHDPRLVGDGEDRARDTYLTGPDWR